ncbi:TFIIIC subunit-domain-containing protein [Aspergillus egyptiacus]|nr:TFIIIC subunit-domain-containing protein [Aspergillus egyptiacus]
MSALDPALLSDPSPDDDSEWEYEYHDTETETFYLNIDLTTHNGPVRPPRRRNETSASAPATTDPTPATPSRADDQEPAMNISEPDSASAERIQILGLHTKNPIVSYQNQIFSGSWADQIGTELFFARPDTIDPDLDDPDSAPPPVTPLKRTKDFDLVAANSVKILGRKANLISSSGLGTDQSEQVPSSSAPSSTVDMPGLIYKPEYRSSQARFIERLKDIKRQKGETDTVRTVFSTPRRGPSLEDQLRGWVRTDEQLAAIQQLNDRALRGDPAAYAELQSIYSHLGRQDAASSSGGPSRYG